MVSLTFFFFFFTTLLLLLLTRPRHHASAAAAAPPHFQTRDEFVRVPLEPPLNYQPGDSLFPSRVMQGWNDAPEAHTAETWAAYVLSQCEGSEGCTSSVTFSAINSGSTGGRFWFGYAFWGGPTTVEDYRRDNSSESQVTDSIAYTIVN
ncbi:hypothetical protein F4778DRAFT_781079 [Xylariomycetidae sp. FL2044]|nr:hypothetical protein F4778DRAFT_781079 [Xylariomycetidae sp. FL2044]